MHTVQVTANGTRTVPVATQLVRTGQSGMVVAFIPWLRNGMAAAVGTGPMAAAVGTGPAAGMVAAETGTTDGMVAFMVGGGSTPVCGGPTMLGATLIGGVIRTRTMRTRRRRTLRLLTVRCRHHNNLGTTAIHPRATTRRCRLVPAAGIRSRQYRRHRPAVRQDHLLRNNAAQTGGARGLIYRFGGAIGTLTSLLVEHGRRGCACRAVFASSGVAARTYARQSVRITARRSRGSLN